MHPWIHHARLTQTIVPWTLACLAVVLTLLILLFSWVAHNTESLFTATVIVLPLTGTVILARRPGNRIGWLMVSLGTIALASGCCEAYARAASTHAGWPGASWAAWLSSWTLWGPLKLYLVLLALLFPTGRLLSPRWRAVVVLMVLTIGTAAVLDLLQPGPIENIAANPALQNPVGIPWLAHVHERLIPFLDLLLLLTIMLAVAAVVVRFRRSRGIERQQMKWFTFVAVLVIVLIVAMVVAEQLPAPLDAVLQTVFGVWFLLSAIVGLPVTIALAILRYRLYDIDRVINRALVYGVLTVATAGSYAIWVILLQQVLSPLTRGSDLAVAGATLAVAALFRPARSTIQRLVERRFYRQRYDAARTIDAFAARLRDEIDLDTLTAELRGVVQETMQPRHVSLWMHPRVGARPATGDTRERPGR